MQFRTPYCPERSSLTLVPYLPLAMLGSCFADNIAARMRQCLWDARNPLGTLYNPLSIARALDIALLSETPEDDFTATLMQTGGIWHSWLFDTSFSARDTVSGKRVLSERRHWLDEALSLSRVLFVTFGTAWCYYLADSPDYLVANCHKQPAAMFERRRLEPDEIIEVWCDMTRRLRQRYPGLQIIFTVSPVRHLKDGFAGNSLSKSILRLAVARLCEEVEECSYFPAFEIVNDDLRDYRFYDTDMVHPSAQAVEYIWEILCATYIDSTGISALTEGSKIMAACKHRPLMPLHTEEDRRAEQQRQAKIAERYERFRQCYPYALAPDKI
ncbi:MAG: GSCFA domain-containing protein [Muribaculaceae bacterium]|nr:GSCFA domain-containing protein [Muribaculaceae bacterium]